MLFLFKGRKIFKRLWISHQIIILISQEDKEKYKIFLGKKTFPQIYYQDCYNRRYSLGGCSEFEEFIKMRMIK